jgi:hypothetical protein
MFLKKITLMRKPLAYFHATRTGFFGGRQSMVDLQERLASY